jgi:hypothetical protein
MRRLRREFMQDFVRDKLTIDRKCAPGNVNIRIECP